MSDFNALVKNNTRQDDYVNATKWCTAYGKRFNNYSRLADTKRAWNAVAARLDSDVSRLIIKGDGHKDTYVHPLIAVHLSQWLNPDFHAFVLDIFRRYLEADITLADEIIQKQTDPKAIAWIKERIEGKEVRLGFTAELEKRGVTKMGFGANTNAIYLGVFGDTCQGLKEVKGLAKKENLRDNMSMLELTAVKFAELVATKLMDEKNAHGNDQTIKCSHIAANRVGKVLDP